MREAENTAMVELVETCRPSETVAVTRWTAQQVASIAATRLPEAPLITQADAAPVSPDLTLWDLWPVQTDDGSIAKVAGGSLWVVLSAARSDDPDDRHDVARMRLFLRRENVWQDCGPLMPDGFSPGSREWSGSTRLDPETGRVTLWFTATGRRTGGSRFEQRLFLANGFLDVEGDLPRVTRWENLIEAVPNDGSLYVDTAIAPSLPGRIKGFRDPFWFRDPQSGIGYLLFAGSVPTHETQSDYDGVVGIAQADDQDGTSRFLLLPPIINASGVSNELELPHVLYRDGAYYLFWCSQASVFAPDGPKGPTGLYGMVAPGLFGPYEPLNGSGLVLANPVAEPRQAYAWRVLPSLEVVSFVDYWGLEGRDINGDPGLKTAQFGGTIAPMCRLEIDGHTTRLVQAPA